MVGHDAADRRRGVFGGMLNRLRGGKRPEAIVMDLTAAGPVEARTHMGLILEQQLQDETSSSRWSTETELADLDPQAEEEASYEDPQYLVEPLPWSPPQVLPATKVRPFCFSFALHASHPVQAAPPVRSPTNPSTNHPTPISEPVSAASVARLVDMISSLQNELASTRFHHLDDDTAPPPRYSAGDYKTSPSISTDPRSVPSMASIPVQWIGETIHESAHTVPRSQPYVRFQLERDQLEYVDDLTVSSDTDSSDSATYTPYTLRTWAMPSVRRDEDTSETTITRAWLAARASAAASSAALNLNAPPTRTRATLASNNKDDLSMLNVPRPKTISRIPTIASSVPDTPEQLASPLDTPPTSSPPSMHHDEECPDLGLSQSCRNSAHKTAIPAIVIPFQADPESNPASSSYASQDHSRMVSPTSPQDALDQAATAATISSDQLIFQKTLTVLFTTALPSTITSSRIQVYVRELAALDPISRLIRSREYRKKLFTLAESLQIAAESKLRRAIQQDEGAIAELVRQMSTSEVHRQAILALDGDDAQSFLDVVQDVLDRGFLVRNDDSRRVRRLLIRLCERCHMLPTTMCIKDITNVDTFPSFCGGFGDVYRASHKGKVVALKKVRMFPRDHDAVALVRKRFCKEALLWHQLDHPYIVPFLGIDVDTFGSQLCLVSPWMRHGTVLTHLNDCGRSNVHKTVFEIIHGLVYLHSKKIVHGDLRGANILINDKWEACLTDFGLTVFNDATATNQTSRREGSIRWMAPELHQPEKFGFPGFRLTPESDIYSFACVCLELYTGLHPFPDIKLDTAVLLNVIAGVRPKRPVSPISIPDEIWTIVERCWVSAPSDRMTTPTVAIAMHRIVAPSADPLQLPSNPAGTWNSGDNLTAFGLVTTEAYALLSDTEPVTTSPDHRPRAEDMAPNEPLPLHRGRKVAQTRNVAKSLPETPSLQYVLEQREVSTSPAAPLSNIEVESAGWRAARTWSQFIELLLEETPKPASNTDLHTGTQVIPSTNRDTFRNASKATEMNHGIVEEVSSAFSGDFALKEFSLVRANNAKTLGTKVTSHTVKTVDATPGKLQLQIVATDWLAGLLAGLDKYYRISTFLLVQLCFLLYFYPSR